MYFKINYDTIIGVMIIYLLSNDKNCPTGTISDGLTLSVGIVKHTSKL